MQEYSVQAIRTLNFARFTEWSANTLKNYPLTITLCAIGNQIVHDAFAQIDKQQVGRKKIRIVHLHSLSAAQQCQLLFISGDDYDLKKSLRKIKSLPILTIGESDHFLQNGGMVQLHMENGTILMSINLKTLENAGLHINSKVLRLAKVVKELKP